MYSDPPTTSVPALRVYVPLPSACCALRKPTTRPQDPVELTRLTPPLWTKRPRLDWPTYSLVVVDPVVSVPPLMWYSPSSPSPTRRPAKPCRSSPPVTVLTPPLWVSRE